MSSPSPDARLAPGSRSRLVPALLLVSALALSCERESRQFRHTPAAPPDTRMSSLQPGPATAAVTVENPYDSNAFSIAQGKRLFSWMNCVGCHAHGGGAIGPPLMDAKWIYGGQPQDIFSTIVEGRPNGMPAYAGKLPEKEVWQLVAYVQSLSGHVRKDAAPGRSDHMHAKQRELAKETEPISGQPGKTP